MAKKREVPAMVEQIRAAVRSSGLTSTVLAERTGVDTGRISRFMRGERDLTLHAAARLCAALGLELRPVGKRPRRKRGQQ
jgi:transcriptional regulator with XRE-family HTH domain